MDGRHGKQAGIEPVEPAAVAGKRGAGVRDAGAALEGGLGEVADLSGGVAGQRDERGGGWQWDVRKQPTEIKDAVKGGGDGTCDPRCCGGCKIVLINGYPSAPTKDACPTTSSNSAL